MRLAAFVGTLFFVVSAASADEIFIDGKRLDVTVTGCSNHRLTYQQQKAKVTKDLSEIDRIVLAGFVAFNQGEQMLAARQYDQALQKYALAAKQAKQDWHKTLIRARSEQAGLKGAPPPVKAATGPASRPAAQSKNPLESMHALARDLATAPRDPRTRANWSELSKYDQDTALKDYEPAVAEWKKTHSYKDAKVTWRVTLVAITTADDNKSTLVAQGGKDLTLQAALDASEELKATPIGKELIVSGTIKDYTFKLNAADGIFDTESFKLAVTLKDVTVAPAPAKK